MILCELLDTGGLRLSDDQTGETYEVAGDRDGQRLGRLIRRLATERYAGGHADGLTEGRTKERRELEAAERRGPVRRARLALN
jgi:hypothetical protein